MGTPRRRLRTHRKDPAKPNARGVHTVKRAHEPQQKRTRRRHHRRDSGRGPWVSIFASTLGRECGVTPFLSFALLLRCPSFTDAETRLPHL